MALIRKKERKERGVSQAETEGNIIIAERIKVAKDDMKEDT